MGKNTDILKTFLNAEINKNMESMASCLHDDFILDIVGPNEQIQGKTNFLNVMQKVFKDLKDWNLGVIRMIGNRDSIVVEFDGSGHFAGEFEGKLYSGVPIRSRSICVFDFEVGLIKKCAEYYDSQSFKQQFLNTDQ